MSDEPFKIILRRFRDRFMESGLLILAVALGIGAASAGITLLAANEKAAKEMLTSPAYREIVVSTASDAEDMEQPVSLKPVEENAVLTSADLDAAEIAPAVSFAYVRNHKRMDFINETSVEQDARRMEAMGNAAPPEGEDRRGPVMMSEEELESLSSSSDVFIAELEEISGYEVSPGFFSAWDIFPAWGSLFSDSDMTGTDSIVLLGDGLARQLTPDGEDADFLLGKKLLTRGGLITVVGILQPMGDLYDTSFFEPYRSGGAFGGLRMGFMNTQLRFSVEEPASLDGTADLLQQWFDSRFGEDQIVISNPRAEAQQLIDRNRGTGLLILFLSLAGLFIASVNVSNILMSRALRMKKHVGILMALGSSRNGIMRLFGMEALMITLTGALLGAGLSIPLGRYMQEAMEITAASWIYTLPGILVSAVLTLTFCLIPARQFSKIDPAQAMRAA